MEIVKNNMEELKKKSVNTESQEGKQEKAPSYEQLKNWCDQLMMQRNQLAERLGQITDIVNKLPWLFKVIENKDIFNKEFVDYCISEVTYILTPPEEEQPDKEQSTDKEATKE